MAGKFGAQAVSLLLSFVLTRLLDPGDFGIAGIAMVIVLVSSVFLDMGFGRALVQQKQIGQAGYSSVFFLNILFAVLLMIICYFVSGILAKFYNQKELAPVLKTLSLLFLINSVSFVPGAILVREMKFKLIAVSGLISSAIAGIVSIIMALKGYGVWSLVVQYLLSAGLNMILNFYFVKWQPSFVMSMASLKPLWSYGSRMFSSSILSNVVTRLDIFIIGKLFNVTTLGYYSRAQTIDNAVRLFSSGSIASVFFPAAAKLQDDREHLLHFYKRYLHFVSFLSVGVSGLLYLITPDLFGLLFTAKWNTSALYFQVMCVAGFVWPMSALMITLISGVGNSKAFLRLELIRVAIQLPIYFIGLSAGIIYFLWLMVAFRIISLSLNAFFISRELSIKISEQLMIIFIYLLQGLVAVIVAGLFLKYMNRDDSWFRLLMLILVYCFVYMTTQYLIKTIAFKELVFLYRRLVAKG